MASRICTCTQFIHSTPNRRPASVFFSTYSISTKGMTLKCMRYIIYNKHIHCACVSFVLLPLTVCPGAERGEGRLLYAQDCV